MNNTFTKLHDKIIDSARNRILNSDYDIHHILPASLCKQSSRYGLLENYTFNINADDECNLVRLTREEHFIIHVCLYKMYPQCKELQRACALMGGKHADIYNLKELGTAYAECINSYRKTQSKNMSGENNPMYGKAHSAQTKKKISEKAKSRVQCDEQRQKQRDFMNHNNPFKGKSHNELSKSKMRGKRVKSSMRRNSQWKGFIKTPDGIYEILKLACVAESCDYRDVKRNLDAGRWTLIPKESIIMIFPS